MTMYVKFFIGSKIIPGLVSKKNFPVLKILPISVQFVLSPPQQTLICSKSTLEALEKGLKYVKN